MVIQALQKVFRNPAYVALALFISVSIFVFAVLLPNIRLVAGVVSSPNVPLLNKFELPFSLLGSITTNFTVLSATYTIAISILFGMYIAMAVYFLRRKIKDIKQSGMAIGFLGIASGVLGVGCGACGAFLLTSLLSTFGIAGIISYLPFDGGEFGIIGVILLIASIHITAKKIMSPQVCSIKN
jgi:hypothetical protein